MSMLVDLRGFRYFLRIEVASGFVCQLSSMIGTRRGHVWEYTLVSGFILWISEL